MILKDNGVAGTNFFRIHGFVGAVDNFSKWYPKFLVARRFDVNGFPATRVVRASTFRDRFGKTFVVWCFTRLLS